MWSVTVINLLAPIFLVIALGAALQRGGMLGRDLVAGINRLLYWVGLPAAVLHAMVDVGAGEREVGPLLLVLVAATLVNAGLSWLTAGKVGISPACRGTYVQAAFRGNLSFVALPLLLTVPGVPLGPAMLAFAPMVILHNTLTVVVLSISQTGMSGDGWRRVGAVIVRNPIIIASAVGALWAALGWSWPTALGATLQALGRMALPLALLCVGAALMMVPVGGNRRHAGWAAAHKVVLSPVLGYVGGRLLGLDDATMLVLLICLACPTASISYTMAQQMGGDEGLAATAVVYSAVASAVSLGVVIAVFAL